MYKVEYRLFFSKLETLVNKRESLSDINIIVLVQFVSNRFMKSFCKGGVDCSEIFVDFSVKCDECKFRTYFDNSLKNE